MALGCMYLVWLASVSVWVCRALAQWRDRLPLCHVATSPSSDTTSSSECFPRGLKGGTSV